MPWSYRITGKISKNDDSVLICGLPGIGNVGKIVTDFLVDELKLKRTACFESSSMPSSVVINDDNLVELPKIEIYGGKGIYLLTGNFQPISEESCYEFCECALDCASKLGIRTIVTLGGIGLREAPENPEIYLTGNSKEFVTEYKKRFKSLKTSVYGVVGPIMGVSGVLLGLAGKRGIQAVSMLGETLAHPLYFGFRTSKKMLEILKRKYSLDIDLGKLDKEIEEIDSLMKSDEDIENLKDKPEIRKYTKYTEMNYIG